MSKIEDGGLAFPNIRTEAMQGFSYEHGCGGITIQDAFAMAALKGILAYAGAENWTLQDRAGFCYSQADAMLKERERTIG